MWKPHHIGHSFHRHFKHFNLRKSSILLYTKSKTCCSDLPFSWIILSIQSPLKTAFLQRFTAAKDAATSRKLSASRGSSNQNVWSYPANHFWFVVESEMILCLFQKVSVGLLLLFLNKRKWPCFWKPQCYLEIHNPNEVSESKERWLGDSNELKAIQRVWELRVAFVHRNQQQQQPEQLLSFGRVTFLHLHKMTMPIAGLFNLGLWMFPTWPACDTHVTAFQSCQSLNIFMTLTKDTKGFKGFQHQKGYWYCWDHPETLPSLRWNALRVLCQRARRQT